ncbi:hypothetical protein ACQP1V_27625 [Microtetraspora malaysiensis]|uniref:hypothetical protein n=1 Tax=Microtetraspora malaysiensis TaxID=161358 RepID=UPI003D9064ED
MADGPHWLPIIYRTARRVYRDLLAVGAMTLAPGVGLPLIVLVAMGHRIVIVNGSPHLVHYTLAGIGALAAAGLAAILSGLLFLVAGSRVVLDHICGRPVSAIRALWAILRRPHSFLLLAVQFGVAFTALVGAALWLSVTVRSVIPGLILLLGVGVFLLLPAMTAWAAGRPVVFRASGYPELIFCDDAACTGSRTTELREYFDIHPGVAMAADGSLAVAGWTHKPGWKTELETFSCRPDGCARRSGSPLRVAKDAELEVRAAAVATRNGIVIASIAPDPDDRDDRNGRNALVDLTTCPEITCAHPITVRLGRLLSHITDVTVDERTLAVTASPDGRPIVAYADRYTQETTLAICDSAVCAHPVIRTFDPTQWRQGAWSWGPLRVQVAVRPDGRPVIVRNDPHDLSTTIVVCRDRVCSGTPRTARVTEVVALGTPGLTLDPRGRLLLVGYDRDYPLMSILTCEDDACTSRSTGQLVPAYGFGYFDLAAGPDGRPRLLWYGRLGPAGTDAYHLLTCVDARCSA